MKEVAKVLRNWQLEDGKCVGSVLYSDIGKKYYAKLGWNPDVNNFHLVFPPWTFRARQFVKGGLEGLCHRDEAMIRAAIATPNPKVQSRITIPPDLDHMLWHIRKEEFSSKYIFEKVPRVKGAIAGSRGKEVWAIWSHRYYGHPNEQAPDNVLYILRLVIDGNNTASKAVTGQNKGNVAVVDAEQAVSLKAVIQAAQAEASDWRLDHVKMWSPPPLVRSLLAQGGFEYEEEALTSGMWCGDGDTAAEAPSGSIMSTTHGVEREDPTDERNCRELLYYLRE